jgi:23S rRNA (pseudouridine1915-N3)-methyltransferase
MKIQLWSIGKPHEPYVQPGIDEFTRRLNRYYPAEWVIIPPAPQKKKESEIIIGRLSNDDYLVALDEKGEELSSEKLAAFIGARSGSSVKNLIFLIGGAFGLDGPVLKRADYRWSLGRLTFPHQLARLILAEQLYRACTILRNEKYHHS